MNWALFMGVVRHPTFDTLRAPCALSGSVTPDASTFGAKCVWPIDSLEDQDLLILLV